MNTRNHKLAEEDLPANAEAVAWRRVIAFQITRSMEAQNFTKAEMARRMQTRRAAVDRLPDRDNESATLVTLEEAALAVGKRLHLSLVQA
jgi:antitoxin HicB